MVVRLQRLRIVRRWHDFNGRLSEFPISPNVGTMQATGSRCGPTPNVPSCLETVLYVVGEDVFGTFWRSFSTQIQILSIKQGLPAIRSSQVDVWTGNHKIQRYCMAAKPLNATGKKIDHISTLLKPLIHPVTPALSLLPIVDTPLLRRSPIVARSCVEGLMRVK